MPTAPFLVRIRYRDGRVRDLPRATPAQAQRAVARLAHRPELDRVHWMAHPARVGPALFLGRYLPDIPGIGARGQVAHLFLIAPGSPIGPADPVTARCGEPIRADQLAILSSANPLPCYRCRLRGRTATPGHGA